MAGRPTVTVPIYEYVDRSSPGTYFDDLEEALRTGATMVEIDAEEAAAFQGVRHHFDHPKVPDPETLSDDPTPGPEWTEILLELGGEDPARRAGALQHVLTSGTCGWKRSPTTDDLKKAVENPAPDKRQTMALHEWADTAGWRMLALGWAHGLYTPASLASALHRTGLSRCPAADHLKMGAYARTPAEPAGG